MEKKTTIQIAESTKQRLNSLKMSERETFDGVIRRMLDELPGEKMGGEAKKAINERLREVGSGNVLSTEQLRKKLFRRHGNGYF